MHAPFFVVLFFFLCPRVIRALASDVVYLGSWDHEALGGKRQDAVGLWGGAVFMFMFTWQTRARAGKKKEKKTADVVICQLTAFSECDKPCTET